MPIGWVGLWDRIRTDDGEAGSWVFGSVWRVVQGREKARVLRQEGNGWVGVNGLAGARWEGKDEWDDGRDGGTYIMNLMAQLFVQEIYWRSKILVSCLQQAMDL